MATQVRTTYPAGQYENYWPHFAVSAFSTMSQEVIGSYATLISERISKQKENNSVNFSLEKPT